jgi:putative oxidoreductase
MKTLIPTRVAIILYAIVMGLFGVIHFVHASIMAAAVPIPGGKTWIYITGLALILAAISFIINVMVKLAGYLLALFLLIVIVLVHIPHATEDLPSLTMLLKDVALMAAAIIIANTGK